MEDLRLGLGAPGGAITAGILAVLVVVAVVVGVWELRRDRNRRRAMVLGSLRVLTGLAALAVAVQPTLTGERVTRSEGRLAILADASRSMGVAPSGAPRVDEARALLARWSDGPRSDTVATFAFGGSPTPSALADLADSLAPVEEDTRIVGSIAELVAEDDASDLGAVVVVSDGADQGRGGLGALARSGVKVHAVAIGAEESLRDDSIAAVEADPVAFLRQQARVRVVVRALGGDGGPVPVSLRLGEELVREVVAEPDAHGEAAIEIPFTPARLGRAVYRLSIPVTPDDAVPENNERAFLVRVTRDKLRVLLVAGRPSWDERFLRAFLKRDPAIDLISFFILRTASDLTMAASDELALIPFPTDELFSEHLGSFDLVVFQNFEYAPYQMAGYLPSIRDYVVRGGGFAMVGGDLAFGSGGYAETALGEILPVTMPPAGTPETRALALGSFAPTLSPALARHPLLTLLPDPAANAEAWSRLATLEGANVITGLRGDGRPLLLHPRERTPDGAPMPVLAVGTAGRGRTLALATDTSWRWGITTGGSTGDPSAYERFWDRALRWLTHDPALEPAHVTTDRERYGAGARIRVEALLRDDSYEPLADREVRLAIVDDAGDELAARDVVADGRGEARARLEGPRVAGGYRVVARLAGAVEALCEEGFVVETGGDELADPRSRPETLRELAERTGGTFHTAEDAPALARFDTTRTRSLGTHTFAPFGTGWSLLGLVVLFGAEWLLRRAWGRR
jgi:uncharacterized membrane protein